MTTNNYNFKRQLCLLLMILTSLVLLPSLPASAATNLLVNPGFEQGDANWDGLQEFTVTGPGHTGNFALYAEGTDRIVVQQCIPISQAEWNSWTDINGQKFVNVDGWIKTNEYVEQAYIEIWVWSDSLPAFPCNGAGSHWNSPVLLGSKNWTKLSQAPGAVFNPFGVGEKPAAISISLVVEVVEGANAVAAFDDLTLTNVNPGPVTLSEFTAKSPWAAFGSVLPAAENTPWVVTVVLLAGGVFGLGMILRRRSKN